MVASLESLHLHVAEEARDGPDIAARPPHAFGPELVGHAGDEASAPGFTSNEAAARYCLDELLQRDDRPTLRAIVEAGAAGAGARPGGRERTRPPAAGHASGAIRLDPPRHPGVRGRRGRGVDRLGTRQRRAGADCYKAVLQRDGTDDRGMDLISLVNVTAERMKEPPALRNAFWWQKRMWYGQVKRDGRLVSLSRHLDVIGHELTHGVIESTSGLIYTTQSGALNFRQLAAGEQPNPGNGWVHPIATSTTRPYTTC